jgi:hypothetical protein
VIGGAIRRIFQGSGVSERHTGGVGDQWRGHSGGDEGKPVREVRPVTHVPADLQGSAERTLSEALGAWVREGRTVRIAVGETVWQGRPAGVSAELVQVGPTLVVLARVTSIRAGMSGVHAAAARVEPPATLRELLQSVADRAEQVEVGGPDIEPVQGRVLAVMPGSHIELLADDGSEWLLPLSSLGWLSIGAGAAD